MSARRGFRMKNPPKHWETKAWWVYRDEWGTAVLVRGNAYLVGRPVEAPERVHWDTPNSVVATTNPRRPLGRPAMRDLGGALFSIFWEGTVWIGCTRIHKHEVPHLFVRLGRALGYEVDGKPPYAPGRRVSLVAGYYVQDGRVWSGDRFVLRPTLDRVMTRSLFRWLAPLLDYEVLP